MVPYASTIQNQDNIFEDPFQPVEEFFGQSLLDFRMNDEKSLKALIADETSPKEKVLNCLITELSDHTKNSSIVMALAKLDLVRQPKEITNDFFKSQPIQKLIEGGLKTQAAMVGKYMAENNCHNGLLMEVSHLILDCDTMKDINIKLLQAPEEDDKSAFLIPNIPFEQLEGQKAAHDGDFDKPKNFASVNEQLSGLTTHNTSIQNPLWYQIQNVAYWPIF